MPKKRKRLDPVVPLQSLSLAPCSKAGVELKKGDLLIMRTGGGGGNGSCTTTGLQMNAFSPSTRHRSKRGTSILTVSDWHLQCDAFLPIADQVSVAKFVDSATLYPWLKPQWYASGNVTTISPGRWTHSTSDASAYKSLRSRDGYWMQRRGQDAAAELFVDIESCEVSEL